MDIIYIDDQKVSDEELARIHALSAEVEKEALPDDPPTPFEEFRGWVRHVPEFRKNHRWVIRDPGDPEQMIGHAALALKYVETNRSRGSFWIEVRKDVRRRGLGKLLLAAVLTKAEEEDRTLLDSWTNEGADAEKFLEAMGMERRYRERQSRLYIEEVDREMLRSWVARAEERASEYEIVAWDGQTPDDLLPAFADLKGVMNTAPREEFEEEDEVFTPERIAEQERVFEARGNPWWTMVARHPSGEFAGYTELTFSKWRDWLAYQGDTGVRPSHRDRGLGRWLKAAMLERLIAENPEVKWIDTWNAGSNRPMLNINEALGFRPLIYWGAWQADRSILEARQ
jgi:mycothiol synthase